MMEIRLATAEDADGIWALLQPVFRAGDTYAIDPQITRDAALAFWMGQAACYVAVDDGAIIGTYYIKTNQQGGGAHICNCGYIVAQHAQGRGVAATICAHSQQSAAAMGYRATQFNLVLASNTGALRLWTRLGFATVGVIPDAFDHPTLGLVDAHVMYKSLIG